MNLNEVQKNQLKELSNTIESDYKKLNEGGRLVYLNQRKNDLKGMFLFPSILFVLVSIVSLVLGIVYNMFECYIFFIVAIILAIVFAIILIWNLKQPNEKLIKEEIRKRVSKDLIRKYQKPVSTNTYINHNDSSYNKQIELLTSDYSKRQIWLDSTNKRIMFINGD